MLVTGVQAVGAKGVTSIQATVVDPKETTRSATNPNHDADLGAGISMKPGEPQPVAFPRSGVAVDQRPVALRRQHAAERYRENAGHDDAA